ASTKGVFVMGRMNEATNTGGTSGTTGGIGETASQVQENLREMGGQIRDQATQAYSELRDQAADYYEQGRQRAQEWEQSLEEYVQQKPIQSLLIAAGVGMLLGMLWRRS